MRCNGFPSGTFHLKSFRWKDRNFLSLFENPEDYKRKAIEPLLKRFPQRRFILVGDSGERDPEAYGALARKFPLQIEHIYIRNVTGETVTAERYQRAFAQVPPQRWRLFRDPAELRP
jgi:phosphatidate phosphatase APP1